MTLFRLIDFSNLLLLIILQVQKHLWIINWEFSIERWRIEEVNSWNGLRQNIEVVYILSKDRSTISDFYFINQVSSWTWAFELFSAIWLSNNVLSGMVTNHTYCRLGAFTEGTSFIPLLFGSTLFCHLYTLV